MQLEELVGKFREKNVAAFEILYGMYAKNICSVINTIIKNEERSQEICQDVFVKIWENAGTYKATKGRFFTWILNIARNAAIDELRSRSYKNEKKNLSADYFVSVLESKQEEVARSVDTEGLLKLVQSLKKKCIQLIELLYFRGYTQKEAAEELAIPVGTVKTRNRSCISKLRENMDIK